jgi:signal peptidase I
MEKDILLKKKKQYEDFWGELLKVQYNDLSIDSVCLDIKHLEYIDDDIKKELLNNAIKVKSNEITIREFQDIVCNYINEISLKIRCIEDSENNILRKPFHPEKLIGKTVSLKPYDSVELRYFKIISIKSHFPVKEKKIDEDMVVYNVYEDGELNTLPLYQYRVQGMIDKGYSTTKDTYRYGEEELSNECIYKIVD